MQVKPEQRSRHAINSGKTWFSILSLAGALGLVGCNTDTTSTPEPNRTTSQTSQRTKLKVVATTSVLCNLTAEIAVDTVDLTCLLPAGADPHAYQAKPETAKTIANAQLILYNGYNFEPSVIKLVQNVSTSATKIAIAETAIPQPLMGELEPHGHKANSNSQVPDPHVWHHALNGVKMAEAIKINLAKLSPENADLYATNTKKITTELQQVDSWIKGAIATIPVEKRKLITTHDALSYYANAYNIPIEGALSGITTEEQPTPTRIAELVGIIRTSKVPTIFAEVTVNPRLITTVAKEANVKIADRAIFSDGLGEKGTEGETYLGMLKANTRTIVEGLGGKYTPFQSK